MRRKGLFRKRQHPLPEAALSGKGIMVSEPLNLTDQFLSGNLASYLRSDTGKRQMDELIKDKGKLISYLNEMLTPETSGLMAKFLMSKEGIDTAYRIAKDDEGLRLLIDIGQTPQGRSVARKVLSNPIKGWPAAFRLLKLLGMEKQSNQDQEAFGLTYDLTEIRNTDKPAAQILPYLKNNSTVGSVFISLSETDMNAEVCKEVLKDEQVRKALFDYLRGDPDRTVATFKQLFRSRERRKRTADIFMSRGGTRLLIDLAGDPMGRLMIMSLSVMPEGRSIGIKVLLRNPITIIRVGIAFFREKAGVPEQGQRL